MYSHDSKGNSKNTIDVVGVKKITPFVKGIGHLPSYYDVKGIEAKASLADYKNGFCQASMYSYVITPINTIPIELIPDKIGFIEVDFNNFYIKKKLTKYTRYKWCKFNKKSKKEIR